MIIRRVVIERWRGFTFDIDFFDGMNILIGMNGCGKTTILDLIAGLTGTDRAGELLRGKFDFIRLDVEWEANTHVIRFESITLTDSFDTPESIYEITRFKKMLPVRTSYVLRHDLYDDRYLGEPGDRETNIKETLRDLEGLGLGLKRQLRIRPNYVHYMLSDSGAQRYLLTVGMRLSAPGIPMLVDMPERSLHVIIRRNIHGFYARFKQQVIYATHCPEIVSYAMQVDLHQWHHQTSSQRPKHPSLIDLHDGRHTNLRRDYNSPE